MLKRLAIVRKDTVRACPFGLPILDACKNAGDSIDRMQDLETVDENKREKVKAANRKIYVYHKTNKECPYADKIVNKFKAVHCDYEEAGAKIKDFPLRPSPFYPRVFNGLGQTGLFSYPVDFYWDNPEARSLFSGIYSIYASTGEISLSKTANSPDSLLISLAKNIVIKEE